MNSIEQTNQIDKYLGTININETSKAGFTPLFRASALGELQVVQILLQKGADPNKQSIHGQSPLFCTIENERLDIASALLKNGAEINLQDKNGKTPLMYASGQGKAKMTKHLVREGSNINIADKTGNTPLLYGFKATNKEIVSFLIENGANMDHKNENSISGNIIKQAIITSYNKSNQKDRTNPPASPKAENQKKESTKFRDMVTQSRKKDANRGR